MHMMVGRPMRFTVKAAGFCPAFQAPEHRCIVLYYLRREAGAEWVFGWFKFENRKVGSMVELDRKHLEARSRRFMKNYLNADETRKPKFYRAVEWASKRCQPMKFGLPHTIGQQASTLWTKRCRN
jgi:hypothetical protein